MELDACSIAEYYKDKLVDIYYRFIRPKGEPDILEFAKTYEELLGSISGSINQNTVDISQYKSILKMLYNQCQLFYQIKY